MTKPKSGEHGISAPGSDAVGAGGHGGSGAAGEPGAKRAKPFFDPAEAARIRWERHRAQEAADVESGAAARKGEVVVVRTTVATGEVIARLERDAKGGNVQAARELRSYLAEVEKESDTDVSALDRRTRQRVMGLLLAQIVEEDGVLPSSPIAPSPPGA